MKTISTDILVQFDEIYVKYHKAVYQNISKYIKNEQVADDIFQDVFMSFWEYLRTGKVIHSFSSWLYVVSHNKAISCINKSIKENKVILPHILDEALKDNMSCDGSVLGSETAEEQLQLLYKAVDKLSNRKRIVFCLSRFEGKNIEEIATLLDMTPLSVKEYLKQATRTIKMYVKEYQSLPQTTMFASLLMCYIVK